MRCLWGILAAGLLPGAEGSSEGPRWRCPVRTAGQGFARMEVTPEIFDGSRSSLEDLRLTGAGGRPVPYRLRWVPSPGPVRIAWEPVRLINRTYDPGRSASIVLDFGGPREKNRLRVRLSGENFRRRVRVEGSQDSASWERLEENGWLIEVRTGESRFSADQLQLSPNNFRYLRLTVFHMEDDPPRVEIESVEAAAAAEEAPLVEAPAEVRPARPEGEAKRTVVDLDLRYRNLPVAELALDATDPYFHRGYELLGRNAEREVVERRTETGFDRVEREVPWQPLARGVVHRVRSAEGGVRERLRTERFEGGFRYLRLRIHDGDSPPLSIRGVTAWRRRAFLVFDDRGGREFVLTGGDPRAEAPQYDLGRAVEALDRDDLPPAEAGRVEPLGDVAEAVPWTERHSGLILLALTVLALGVGAAVWRGLRAAGGGPPSGAGGKA